MGTGKEYKSTLLGKDGVGYNPNIPWYEYNPEMARKLLAEAGYAQGFRTKFYTLQDPPAFLAALLQNLRDVGLQIERVPVTLSHGMDMMMRKNLYGMLIWVGGMPGPDPAASFFKTTIQYDGNWAMHGRNERVEELLMKQAIEFDEKKRAAIIDEIIQILWKEAWFIPLTESVQIKAVNTNKWEYENPTTIGSFFLPNISRK